MARAPSDGTPRGADLPGGLAEERDVELVVMGVRGRSPVDIALLGSTTHHVVRGARCPVLVVHTD